ncbi:MAG TPA: penicillin-binding protein 1A [Stellaceae bacterium]|nr:penicillin-binding protein 1A [Stellaceae bacterium]
MKIRKILKYFLLASFLLLLAGIGGFGTLVWYYGRDLPDYKQLADYQPAIVTRIHAGDGRLLAEYATKKRLFVPVSAIPKPVINAFLAAEDHNFYSHSGINYLAIGRAAFTNLIHFGSDRHPVGASTITQQVAKNFLVGNELSFARKMKEALIALRLERVFNKDRILELYLNEIYLGDGAYGVAAAALTYFNRPLDNLSLEEAAFLAALPKGPNNYEPQRFPEAAKARRDWVIERMVTDHFISADAGKLAIAAPLVTRKRDEAEIVTSGSYFAEEVRRELAARFGDKELYEGGLSVRTSLDPKLQAIAQAALRTGLESFDRRHGWRGAIAHLDAGGDWRQRLAQLPLPQGAAEVGWNLALVQRLAPDAAEIGLADGSGGKIRFEELRWARKAIDIDHMGPALKSPADALTVGDVVLVQRLVETGAAGKEALHFALEQIPEVAGGLVAIDPHSGRVLASQGGFSYAISQFDRVTQAKRQIGSAIKPFVYLAALDHGFTPTTLVLDAPFTVDLGPGLPKWQPSNYERKFYGPAPLRVGLEHSRNLMTARLGTVVGLDTVAQYVERFGIMDHMPLEYSMLLGAGETTLMRLTTAYAMLVNGGKRIEPSFIDRVQDREGHTLFRADGRACDECQEAEWQGEKPPLLEDPRAQIADPKGTYQIVSLLEGVVQRGTGIAVAKVGKPLAGKTGTTNDSDDAWFVGFSPDLAVGVYVGYDTPRSLGSKETGGVVAAPIFRDFMAAALADQPATPFRIPPGIRLIRVNAVTGQAARPGDKSVIWEAFRPGTQPNTEASEVVSGQGITDDGPGEGTVDPATETAAPRVTTPGPVPTSGTGGLY